MQHIPLIQLLILARSMHIINICWGPEGTSGNIIDSLRKACWGHYALHTHTFTSLELKMADLELNAISYLTSVSHKPQISQ